MWWGGGGSDEKTLTVNAKINRKTIRCFGHGTDDGLVVASLKFPANVRVRYVLCLVSSDVACRHVFLTTGKMSRTTFIRAF